MIDERGEDTLTHDPTAEDAPVASRALPWLAVAAVIVAVAAGVAFGTGAISPRTTPSASSSGTSVTSVHNDASAEYREALGTGKPIYVLFHSLS